MTSNLTPSQDLEDNASQDQGHYKLDLDESIQAITYANTAGRSSVRTRSIASTQPRSEVRNRQSYELLPDSAPVPAPEPAPELAGSGAWRPERDAPWRADTIGSEADGFNMERPMTEPESRVTIRLSLAALSRMRMRRLQMKLSNRIMRMHYFAETSEDWETLLTQYIAATRDNDYIRTCVDRGLHDPFLIRSERNVDAAILNSELLQIPLEKREKELLLQSINGKDKFNFVPPLEQEPTAIGGTRMETTRKQWTEDFLRRVVLSVIAGAFLVVPMWLMILLNSQRASLITTSVFVFVSGIAAAYALDNTVAVVSTTAAYAAVLVVFVGTSTTPA
ncbi:hypothetical protein ACHAQJ_003113 [Trichoderma viride]